VLYGQHKLFSKEKQTTAPRGQRSPHVFTRNNILAGVEQSLAR
jgi:hypothetical protein